MLLAHIWQSGWQSQEVIQSHAGGPMHGRRGAHRVLLVLDCEDTAERAPKPAAESIMRVQQSSEGKTIVILSVNWWMRWGASRHTRPGNPRKLKTGEESREEQEQEEEQE